MRPARAQGRLLGPRERVLRTLLNAALAGWAAGCGVAVIDAPQNAALLCGAVAFCLALASHAYSS